MSRSPKYFKAQEKNERRVSPNKPSAKENPDLCPPCFSMRYICLDYCLAQCNLEQKAAFADKLDQLSQITWRDFREASRTGMGYEKINWDQIKGSRTRIPDEVTEEVPIIGTRYWNRCRIVGFREGIIFQILWIDYDHSLYDHGS